MNLKLILIEYCNKCETTSCYKVGDNGCLDMLLKIRKVVALENINERLLESNGSFEKSKEENKESTDLMNEVFKRHLQATQPQEEANKRIKEGV